MAMRSTTLPTNFEILPRVAKILDFIPKSHPNVESHTTWHGRHAARFATSLRSLRVAGPRGIRIECVQDTQIGSGTRADKNVQVNVPKTRRTYCKGKDCKKHTQHKVTR